MLRPTRQRILWPLVAALTGCGGGIPSEDDAVVTSTEGIVGGTDSGRGNWPSLVALSNVTFTHQPWGCAGTLIAPTWVLTAGHCVSNTPENVLPIPSNFYVLTGRYNIVSDSGGQIFAKSIVLPDNYNPTIRVPDIALINLVSPAAVPSSRLASPARMAEIVAGSMATTLGWGETISNDATSLSQTLRRADIPVFDYSSGGTTYASGAQFMDLATIPESPVGTSFGDSGGPSLVQRDGEWYILGVNTLTFIDPNGLLSRETPAATWFDWVIGKGASPNPSYLPSAQIEAATAVTL